MGALTEKDREALFNSSVPELRVLIERRRNSWRAISVMEWADVSSILLERLYRQFGHYDHEQPLDRWANTVITNALRNLIRDKVVKTSRPCVSASAYGSACTFNLGCDNCAWTKSGKQDSSCHFYAKWERSKKNKFAVAVPLSIENHVDESHSMQCDFVDIEGAKKLIDENIKRRLTKDEYKIYVLMYVKNLEPKEVGKKMGYKKHGENEVPGYLQIRSARLKIEEVSKQILSEQGIIR